MADEDRRELEESDRDRHDDARLGKVAPAEGQPRTGARDAHLDGEQDGDGGDRSAEDDDHGVVSDL